MKRSQINAAIRTAQETIEKNMFKMPPFAYWTPEMWRSIGKEAIRIKLNGLGWDVTDFGSGNFASLGAVLFTLRNGSVVQPQMGTPYAEKLIIMTPGQAIPNHFHWSKTEDIINRGGSVLMVKLYNALPDDSVDEMNPIRFFSDGVERTVPAGYVIAFQPGESITLEPRVYHKLWAAEDGGILMAGEVSSVNDDKTDNCFAEALPRFTEVEEDEPPFRLLCNEYPE